jgi:hypothetical protein
MSPASLADGGIDDSFIVHTPSPACLLGGPAPPLEAAWGTGPLGDGHHRSGGSRPHHLHDGVGWRPRAEYRHRGAGSGQVGPGATVAITAADLLGIHGIYPGGTGDVVVSITNRNDIPVRVTAVDLPSSTTYATGYTTRAHTVPRTGCSSATSGVAWTRSASGRSSRVPLATPLVIGAHQSATVTMTNGANMRISAPAACEATYFAMPGLIGIGARADARARTSAPTVDSWVR